MLLDIIFIEKNRVDVRDPEEKNIPTGLQGASGEEFLVVVAISVWPSKRCKRPQSRREPCVENIFISLESKFLAWELGGSLGLSLFFRSPAHPQVAITIVGRLTFNLNEVGRCLVAPKILN